MNQIFNNKNDCGCEEDITLLNRNGVAIIIKKPAILFT